MRDEAIGTWKGQVGEVVQVSSRQQRVSELKISEKGLCVSFDVVKT